MKKPPIIQVENKHIRKNSLYSSLNETGRIVKADKPSARNMG